MKLVIASTGASGAPYLQRLLDQLPLADGGHEVHLLLTGHCRQVIQEEIGELVIPDSIVVHEDGQGMNVPFVSGSAAFDAMVVIPCSMGALGRIAHGTSESTLLRAADVFLKEKRKLILVPRETPWHLIHARNVVAVIEAGATVLPACPSFYSNPETISDVVDTVVHRVLDHLGLPVSGATRWKSDSGEG